MHHLKCGKAGTLESGRRNIFGSDLNCDPGPMGDAKHHVGEPAPIWPTSEDA